MRPRQILKGTTYLITRRTTQRMFLLRPSKKVNACIRYCLAVAQRRSGVLVHSAVVLSNHYHLVVTDVEGRLPIFTEEFNKLLARALNCYYGRYENFFSANDQTSHVVLADASDVLAKTVYLLANPTQAHLVSHGTKWPGVRLFRKGDYRAKKPAFFFRREDLGGALPDELALTLTPPPIGEPEARCDEIVQKAVSAKEKQIRQEARANRKTFLGAKAVTAQKIYGTPKTPAPRHGIAPRLACRDKWRRIEILARLDSFLTRYRETRDAFLQGALDVVFPPGTYLMVRSFGARCEEL